MDDDEGRVVLAVADGDERGRREGGGDEGVERVS